MDLPDSPLEVLLFTQSSHIPFVHPFITTGGAQICIVQNRPFLPQFFSTLSTVETRMRHRLPRDGKFGSSLSKGFGLKRAFWECREEKERSRSCTYYFARLLTFCRPQSDDLAQSSTPHRTSRKKRKRTSTLLHLENSHNSFSVTQMLSN